MNQVRFHLDESVDPAIAEGLRRRGADVTTSQSAGMRGAPDEEQLAYSLRNGRVLVTHDDDFLALASTGVSHAGIAYCHPESRSIGQMIAALLLIRDCLDGSEMIGQVEFM